MALPNFTLFHLTENYALCLTTEGKSPKTITWYTANLKRFAQFLDENNLPILVTEIGTHEARRFIVYLQTQVRRWENHSNIRDNKGLSAFSVQGYVRTIKAFWTWLMDEGYISSNPMMNLKLPKTPKKVISTFSEEDIKQMLNSIARTTHRGFRNYTIVLILFDTGIRLSELIQLQVDNVDFLQLCFLVRGKGDKERVVPFGGSVRRALRKYIGYYRPNVDSPQNNYVFLTEQGFPLMTRSVQSMLMRLGKKAGVNGIRCHPHRFRHTFARQYLLQGGDIFSLQKILGHTSLETVKMYVNLLSDDILKQHHKFSPADKLRLLRDKERSCKAKTTI